ncbi:MAG: tetratricopeptide repeat protein [Candidatus Acidiferrales bacterium]
MRFVLIACMLFVSGFALGQTPAPPQSASAASPLFVPWQKEMAQNVSGNKAVYPKIAEMAHVEGCVYVSFVVSTDGSTKPFTIVSGPALLRQSAMDSVKTWRFKPSQQDVVTIFPVCFGIFSHNEQEKLLSSYQNRAEKAAHDPGKLVALGTELFQVGLPEQAATQFRQALSLKPANPEAEFDLGDCLAAEDRFDDAIATYRQGLTESPNDAPGRARLAGVLAAKGDVDEAIAQYQILLQAKAARDEDRIDHSNYRFSLARLLLKKGDVDGAIEQYQEGLHDTPQDPFLHYELGQAFEKKGDTADALKEYQAAMQRMPWNTEFREAYNRLSGK